MKLDYAYEMQNAMDKLQSNVRSWEGDNYTRLAELMFDFELDIDARHKMAVLLARDAGDAILRTMQEVVSGRLIAAERAYEEAK